MTDPAGTTDLDSTCSGCGNPLQGSETCQAGCADRRTPDAQG